MFSIPSLLSNVHQFKRLIHSFSISGLPVGAHHPEATTVSAVAASRFGVVTLSWNASVVREGQLPITGYSILYRVYDSNSKNMTHMTQSSPVNLTGLDPGTTYQVYVASVSAIGIGNYCCTRTKVYFRPHDG